ncbi:MAG: antibiotic biosynthesis monooxygenase [Planctomycetes bacterium]|nr:antibiotic biosynthesis monooxygenase [Planctomycetota bacterium]
MRSVLAVLSIVLIFAVLVGPVPGQDKEDPIVAAVKAGLKNPAKPFTMLVIVKVKEDAGGKFESAFAKAQVETRKEKGNRTYDLNRSAKSPAEYLVYERWQDLAALQAHMKTPHIKTLLSEIGDLLAGPPEVKVLVPVGE